MSTASASLITAAELLQLPQGYYRAELINGVLKTFPLAGIPHGRIAMRLMAPLAQFVLDHELGEVYRAGFQVTWNPDTVLGPDISFISKERLDEAGEVEGYWQGPPDLAVEVLDPEDRPGKVGQKISRWLSFGTKQVWIVDPMHSTITVYRSESAFIGENPRRRTFSGSDYLEAQDLLPGFRIPLDKIFGPTRRTVKESKDLEPKKSVPEVYAEGLRYFRGEGTLNQTLSRLANDLEQRGIDYLVIGAVALLAHGYPRFTESIDLVMTSEGLEKFHDDFDGVSIKITGEFPGDGKPKPVSMPRPAEASVEIDGIRFVTLEKLIELKLASGISASDRLKDLADVQELIKIKRLDADFALKLDPYVRAKYLELEEAVRNSESSQEKYEHTE